MENKPYKIVVFDRHKNGKTTSISYHAYTKIELDYLKNKGLEPDMLLVDIIEPEFFHDDVKETYPNWREEMACV